MPKLSTGYLTQLEIESLDLFFSSLAESLSESDESSFDLSFVFSLLEWSDQQTEVMFEYRDCYYADNNWKMYNDLFHAYNNLFHAISSLIYVAYHKQFNKLDKFFMCDQLDDRLYGYCTNPINFSSQLKDTI